MPLTSVFAGGLLLAFGVLQPLRPAQPRTESDFRWARGAVTSASADALTLRVNGRDLTLVVDAQSEVLTRSPTSSVSRDSPPVLPLGAIVEAHYTEGAGVRRAAFIFELAPGADDRASVRTGGSSRGIVRSRRGTLSIEGLRGAPIVTLDSHTRLLDRDGRSVEKGGKAIKRRIAEGDTVLVSWDEDLISGPNDWDRPYSSLTTRRVAHEIRLLKQSER